MYYDGKKWNRQNADAVLSDAIVRTLRQRGHLALDYDKPELLKKSVLNNSVISACKSRFVELPELYIPVDQFDAHPLLLNCANGIVNLQSAIRLT